MKLKTLSLALLAASASYLAACEDAENFAAAPDGLPSHAALASKLDKASITTPSMLKPIADAYTLYKVSTVEKPTKDRFDNIYGIPVTVTISAPGINALKESNKDFHAQSIGINATFEKPGETKSIRFLYLNANFMNALKDLFPGEFHVPTTFYDPSIAGWRSIKYYLKCMMTYKSISVEFGDFDQIDGLDEDWTLKGFSASLLEGFAWGAEKTTKFGEVLYTPEFKGLHFTLDANPDGWKLDLSNIDR